MTARTVKTGMVTYTDGNGVRRIATAGEEIDVADDGLERFDKLNGEPELEPQKTASEPESKTEDKPESKTGTPPQKAPKVK